MPKLLKHFSAGLFALSLVGCLPNASDDAEEIAKKSSSSETRESSSSATAKASSSTKEGSSSTDLSSSSNAKSSESKKQKSSSSTLEGVSSEDQKPASSSSESSISSVILPSSSTLVSSAEISSSGIEISSSLFISSEVISSSSSTEISTSQTIFPLWLPEYGPMTALGGFLFAFDDLNDGGTSNITCSGVPLSTGLPVDPCVQETEANFNFNITTDIACNWASCNDYGFAAMGMDLQINEGTMAEPYDISGFATVTLFYSSTHPLYFQLVRDEALLGYASHYVKIPAGEGNLTINLRDFRQPTWATAFESIESILSSLVQIKFQAHSELNNYAPANVEFSLRGILLSTADAQPIPDAFTPANSSSSSTTTPSSSSVVSSTTPFTLWKSAYGPTTAEGGYLWAVDDGDNGGTSTAYCDGMVLSKGEPVDACLNITGANITLDVTTDVLCDWTNCKDYGFAVFGLNIQQMLGYEEPTPYDVSAYTYITIDYSSTHPVYFQLVRDEFAIAYGTHFKRLPAGDQTLTLELRDFRQPSWATETELIESILEQLTQIKFQAHSELYSNQPATVDFTLRSLTFE